MKHIKLKYPISEILQSSQRKKNTDFLLKWKFEYMFTPTLSETLQNESKEIFLSINQGSQGSKR